MMDPSQTQAVPTLSSAQRYHLEVFGYVLLENTLDADFVGRLRAALLGLKEEFLVQPDLDTAKVRRCGVHQGGSWKVTRFFSGISPIRASLRWPRNWWEGRCVSRNPKRS